MTTTCFITGIAGFIGSHLAARLLADGFDVIGVDNFDPFYDRQRKQANLDRIAHDRLRVFECDICDRAQLQATLTGLPAAERPKTVYHIAALAGVRPSIEAPHRYAQVNVDGLINVLDAARAVDCRNVIFASSSSVYGNNRKVPFAETDPVDEPISPYAATKRAGELICHTYAHLFGMSIGCLRFFTVFGPAQRPDLAIAKFMDLIARGETVPMFGDGTTSRDYTFIDDIINGVTAAGDRIGAADDGFFRIWNLGGSHPVALSEMIDTIGRVVGKTPQVEKRPMQPGDVERTWADLTRSGDELGYAPTTTFEDGVRAQWSWYEANCR